MEDAATPTNEDERGLATVSVDDEDEDEDVGAPPPPPPGAPPSPPPDDEVDLGDDAPPPPPDEPPPPPPPPEDAPPPPPPDDDLSDVRIGPETVPPPPPPDEAPPPVPEDDDSTGPMPSTPPPSPPSGDASSSSPSTAAAQPPSRPSPLATSAEVFRTCLEEGFASLAAAERRAGVRGGGGRPSDRSSSSSSTSSFEATVRVNFVDRSNLANQMSQNVFGSDLSYFDLIDDALHRDHDRTLRNVPWRNPRSGAAAVAEAVRVTCVRSGGTARRGDDGRRESDAARPPPAPTASQTASNLNLLPNAGFSSLFGRRGQLHGGVDLGKGGGGSSSSSYPFRAPAPSDDTTSTATTAPVANTSATTTTARTEAPTASDATEWHSGDHCHVYVAACDSAEHYRARVRPSLQAFVSQIESAARARRDMGGATRGDTDLVSDQYVVVYVPSGRRDGRSGGVFGGRVPDHAAPPPEQVAADPTFSLSSREKDVLRRLTADFPRGRVCCLSTLELTDAAGRTGPGTVPIATPRQALARRAEWSVFLRHLGAAVSAGLEARWREYDEELRSLDRRRGLVVSGGGTAAATNNNNNGGGGRPKDLRNSDGIIIGRAAVPSDDGANDKSGAPRRLNLSHFFLVKESLALSYEQIRAWPEASLAYDEIRVAMRDAAHDDAAAADNAAALRAAARGDVRPFREAVRRDAVSAADVADYLFVRGVRLAFAAGRPADATERARRRVAEGWTTAVRTTAADRAEAEAAAAAMCWDLRRACDRYFGFGTDEDARDAADGSTSPRRSSSSSLRHMVGKGGAGVAETEREASRRLAETMEFCRSRYLALGDALCPNGNPVRAAVDGRSGRDREPWRPWEECGEDRDDDDRTREEGPSEPWPKRPLPAAAAASPWLRAALTSDDAYLDGYLELTAAAVALHRHAGRARFAARLLTERAEIHAARGDLRRAEAVLTRVTESAEPRHWDRLHAWRLLRLARCQRPRRDEGAVLAYLRTLVRCLAPRAAAVTPPAAGRLLQRDLEALVRQPEVRGCVLSIAPLFETEVTVDRDDDRHGPPTTYSQHPLGFLRKKLARHPRVVGDAVTITLSVRSSLPAPVVARRARLFVVDFDDYGRARRRGAPAAAPEEAHRVLERADPDGLTIRPGPNAVSFSWTPAAVGRFVLAAVELRWAGAALLHDAAASGPRRPLQSVEVAPSAPTQTLELAPLFLLPGHEQEVRAVLGAGNDAVDGGEIVFEVDEGAELHDEEAGVWTNAARRRDLGPLAPGGTRASVARVRVAKGARPSLRARATTRYRRGDLDDDDDAAAGPPMTTTLAGSVATLDRPALTVDRAVTSRLDDDRAVVVVTVRCHAPSPFFLKEWTARASPPLAVERDLNEGGLFDGTPVSLGDEIRFGFECRWRRTTTTTTTTTEEDEDETPSATLRVVLQDELGKTFHQVLPLDLDGLYARLRREDERGAGRDTVAAALECDDDGGVVGAPASFRYVVDASGATTSADRLRYAVVPDGTDWILAGRTRGTVALDADRRFVAPFVAIPTRPGSSARFPAIRAYRDDDDAAPLVVRRAPRGPFRCAPHTHQTALATPSEGPSSS